MELAAGTPAAGRVDSQALALCSPERPGEAHCPLQRTPPSPGCPEEFTYSNLRRLSGGLRERAGEKASLQGGGVLSTPQFLLS